MMGGLPRISAVKKFDIDESARASLLSYITDECATGAEPSGLEIVMDFSHDKHFVR